MIERFIYSDIAKTDMTLISCMKFNDKEGAMVADEQASSHSRKYDIANKIYYLDCGENIKFMVGGSGDSVVIETIINQTKKAIIPNLEHIKNKEDLSNLLGGSMAVVTGDYINNFLSSIFRLNEKEIQSGQVSLNDGKRLDIIPFITQFYQSFIEGRLDSSQLIRNQLLVFARDHEGVGIYTLSNTLTKPSVVVLPYECIGSGSDIADHELYSFFESIPREQRKDINPVKGVCELLNATERASVGNLGVGGIPIINILQQGKRVICSNEKASKLAVEIVKGIKKGLLEEEVMHDSLRKLFFDKKNASFENAERIMWDNAKDKKALNYLLRGYKI